MICISCDEFFFEKSFSGHFEFHEKHLGEDMIRVKYRTTDSILFYFICIVYMYFILNKN